MPALIAAAAIAAAVAGPAVSARPHSTDEISRRLEEIRRATRALERRENGVRAHLSRAAAKRHALTMELEELEAVRDRVQSRVNSAAAVLGGVQRRVDAKTAEIRSKERALESTLSHLRLRAAQVYKHGPASLFDIFLGTEGFGEFLRRFAYMAHVMSADDARVVKIRLAKARIVKERAEVVALRDRLARQMVVVASARDRAAAVANVVGTQRRAVMGDLASGYRELGDIARQRQRYVREQAELRAESAQISALLRGRSAGPAQVSRRGMVWPARGPVTSGFGWRAHPVFHTRRFHAGIDIGAPHGSTVVAAAGGSVVYAGAKTGYGNNIVIDHGGGIATTYAHLSGFAVSTGRRVTRGQLIGRVGCTGYCTGPHLHFEVRVNGDPVNPLNWLP